MLILLIDQVLPKRTHPRMNMHDCPGFLLTGFVAKAPGCLVDSAEVERIREGEGL